MGSLFKLHRLRFKMRSLLLLLAPLLGNHISYTVDVSNVGCHCNSAFYFVQMPGYEGNRETVNVQLHTCDYVAPNYYPHCDGGGCGTNACDGIAGQYGPGRTIDTNQ